VRTLGLVAVLALVAACGACSSGTATSGSASRTTAGGPASTATPSTTARNGATSGGLAVTLSAAPAHATSGSSVGFTLKATETRATGALHYEVAFGDGATSANPTPLFCRAGPGRPSSQTWSLTHHYATPGTYTVTATVGVNCSPDRTTVTLNVAP
jgi:hypothetical protein